MNCELPLFKGGSDGVWKYRWLRAKKMYEILNK